MASQVYLTLSGPQGSLSLAKSCTEGTVGELVDEVSGLSLGEIHEKKTINSLMGTYNAGTCVVWVRNTKTNRIKAIACVNKLTGTAIEYLAKPFVVEYDDIAEAMTQAVA